MHKDIRLHGQTGDHIEYFAMVVGTEAYQRYFFNIVQEEDRLPAHALDRGVLDEGCGA